MKAMQFTKEELAYIAKLNADAEARKQRVAEEKKRADQKKKYEQAERQRAYYEAHKEHIAAYQKEYHEKNREKIAAYQKAYRKASKLSPEEKAAAAAKREEEAAAKLTAREKREMEWRRAYYQKNRDRIRAYQTEYRKRKKAERDGAAAA